MRLLTSFFLALLVTGPAHAGYLAVAESGEILPDGQYQFGLAPQLLLNEGGGATVSGFVDVPVNDATSFRAQAGLGKIDFHAGAMVKYVPFPDYQNQPAMGVKSGLWYARWQSENWLTLQVAPLASRRLQTEQGVLIPYIALPINITSRKDRNYTGVQVAFGSEWKHPTWEHLLLTGELAISLSDSVSALTVGLSFPFDGQRGFRLRTR